MKGKATTPQRKALEMAAKYICNLQDGRCPMVVENYRCLSPCPPDTQPWRCWIDHFLVASGAKETMAAKDEHVREFSSHSRPRSDRWGNFRPTADRDW